MSVERGASAILIKNAYFYCHGRFKFFSCTVIFFPHVTEICEDFSVSDFSDIFFEIPPMIASMTRQKYGLSPAV
jgi:hypothetical protein